MTITIADGRGALWQWDTGRRLRVGSGVEQIHYQNKCFGRSVDVDVGDDGTAIIPDELLQDWHPLTAYAYVIDDAGGYTKVQQDFIVHKRARPSDYVYTPTEHAGFDRLRAEIGDPSTLQTTAKDNLVAAINEVALAGGAGSMSLRVADGYIQYSTDGSTWENLIAVTDLKGADGAPGAQGEKGDKGAAGQDGHSPVVTATKSDKTTIISVDGAAIATIEDGADGAPGKDGTDGLNGKDGVDGKPGAAGANGVTPHIGDNGNWYIGSTDTGNPSRGATGAKGDVGATGPAGPQGPAGAPGSDATVTAASITDALGYKPAAPSDIPAVPTAEINANTAARHTHANKAVIDRITGLVTAENLDNPGHTTDLVQYGAFQAGAQRIIAQIPTVPEALKNPNALTLKVGGATTTYDGSSAQEVDFPEIVVAETITAPAYTNQIPVSADANGAVYNGTGYKSGVYLNSAGEELSGTGLVTSGYIPVKKGDIIRIKDTSRVNIDTTLVMALTAAKAGTANCGKTINAIQSSALYGTVTVSGNVVTWDTSGIGYYFWDNFAWLRVTTHSADAIVTVNEEITDTVTTQNVLKPSVKVKKANVDFDIASPLLSGKTVVCFGDSIFGMTRDTTSVPAWAAAFTGAKVYNVGFGGCRMAVHPTSGYAAFSMWALADAVATGTYTTQDAQASSGADYFAQQLAVLKGIDFGSVDTVVIHYGTNDFTGNVAIDNATDDDDTSTLCGALRYALRKIQTAYPKIRVFISSPIYRKWDSTGAETYTNANGKKLREFCTALAGVADEFNCPCIDGYKALGINTANASAFLADGTHLNEHGRQAFGEYIGGCLISPKA